MWLAAVVGPLTTAHSVECSVYFQHRLQRHRVVEIGHASTVVRTLNLTQWAGRSAAIDTTNHVRCDAPSLAALLDVLAVTDAGDVEVMGAPAPDEPVVYGLR